MHKRMLDVEVVLVMEDSNLVLSAILAVRLLVLVGVAPIRRDRNGGEIDLGGLAGRCVNSSGCHDCWRRKERGYRLRCRRNRG